MEPPKLPGKNDSGAVDSDSRIKLDEKFWKNFRHRFGGTVNRAVNWMLYAVEHY